MEIKYEYVVVGGGVSGMFSAIFAGSQGISTVILEKKNKLGKKMLIAGSGQCNITHTGTNKEFLTKYGVNGRFLKSSLYKFSPKSLQDFFKGEGLELVARKDGKMFPITKKSIDVLEVLYRLCKKYKVNIIKNCEVISIEKDENFILETKLGRFLGENALISTGGITFPQTGSEGQGYKLAKKLGHTIITPKPCLTPIYIRDYSFTELSGVSFKDIKITIFTDEKKVHEAYGDILFTHKNFSGPGVLDNSRYIEKNSKIAFNFIGKSMEEFKKDFIQYTNESGKNLTKTFLNKYNLPEKFIKIMLEKSEIDEDQKISIVNKKSRDNLGKLLTEYRYIVTKLGGIDVGMATCGGVDLKEVNSKTMESKLIKGLYFAGEVLDIDGDTGGYNIQAAISTGVLAALSLKKNRN